MNYVVEKNVPISSFGSRTSYPFPSMQIGDSFVFPKADQKRIAAAAWAYSKKSTEGGRPVRFTIRTTGDGTCRIWRVEPK